MAKRKNGLNKSEEIRQILKASPDMPVKEIVSELAERGIKVLDTQVYFVKGKMRGRKGRRKKARQMVEKVAATSGNDGATTISTADAVATIRKVKVWASEVGGLKKLKSLVDALSE